MSTESCDEGTCTRRALVTGATAGIGREVAARLARDGYEVIVQGRDEDRGQALVTQVVTGGGRARFIAADLTDPADIARLIEQSGPLEVLVNNAGFSAWGPTEDLDPADFETMFTLNVAVPFKLVAGFAPGMAERGRGAIINVTSMAARLGMPGGTAYGASKAALSALSRGWAAEYSPRGVRINAVAPGPTYTRPEATELFTTVGATTLLNRAAQPAEIAEVIAFLASDRASYITGAVLPVDGGRTAI